MIQNHFLTLIPTDVLLNLILETKLDARDVIAFSGTCKLAYNLIHDDDINNCFHMHSKCKPAHLQKPELLVSIAPKWQCVNLSIEITDDTFDKDLISQLHTIHLKNFTQNTFTRSTTWLLTNHVLNPNILTLTNRDLNALDKLTDVSMFGKAHHLTITEYHGVTDVSTLKHVHHLKLDWLCKVDDVSMLGTVRHLVLSRLERVTDVSMLGNMHHLEIYSCLHMTDVSALGTVHHLKLENMYVTDVSALSGVHHLVLSYCHSITNVSALKTVHHLEIEYCNGLTDMSGM